MTRVLFILKTRSSGNHSPYTGSTVSTGLWNSAHFISEMLYKNGIESNVIQVIDNNCIDKAVTEYSPTHVIIEALWVVPEKFDVLVKLHPNVKWIIRIHSEIPFIANEGISMEWIFNYTAHNNVYVSTNSLRMYNNLIDINPSDKIIYLPNYYPASNYTFVYKPMMGILNVACFGSIRPMKNHLAQAIAAIKYVEQNNLLLNFHINSSTEMHGEPILRSLIGLFKHMVKRGHKLVMHPIVPHDEFIELVKTMDVGMQVSLSETFNIVSSDCVMSGIPIITSKEVSWVSSLYHSDPNDVNDIAEKLCLALSMPKFNVKLNKWHLERFVNKSEKIWLHYLKREIDE